MGAAVDLFDPSDVVRCIAPPSLEGRRGLRVPDVSALQVSQGFNCEIFGEMCGGERGEFPQQWAPQLRVRCSDSAWGGEVVTA